MTSHTPPCSCPPCLDDLREYVVATRREQGLGDTVTDPTVLALVAAGVRESQARQGEAAA